MLARPNSERLFSEAQSYFPGGVNSPVRAFRSVGGTPLFIERGEGCHIWDADGHRFLDFCGSWGPLILGHAHPAVVSAITEAAALGTSFGAPTRKENALAKLILDHHPFLDRIRFVSSGTEAVMSAIRLARGATGRNRILKFEGCYHGHVDSLLVQAGSGLVTFGTSSSAGVPPGVASDTLVVPLNNSEALDEALRLYAHELAAVIIEPVPANNGLLVQTPEFMHHLRAKCTEHGVLLIFDEVINGFRIGFTGAAGYYNIKADLFCYGKIIGGGLPVGMYGGRADLMAHIAPQGPVYQAGTLSGNPMAMAAGFAQLSQCLQPGFYENLNQATQTLCNRVNTYAQEKGYSLFMHRVASIFWVAFSGPDPVRSADAIEPQSMNRFRIFHADLLERGIYLGPSGYEVGFVSAAHTSEDLDWAAQAFCAAADKACV